MRLNITLLSLLIFPLCLIQAQELPDTLVVGIKESPPFVHHNKDGALVGISVWLWEQIADELELNYRYEQMNLDELIHQLERGDVDLSINPLTVTSERIGRMDFSQPFIISSSAIGISNESDSSILSFLISIFSLDFLKAILFLFLVIFVFGFLAWLFERKHNPDEFENSLRGIGSGIWWSAVTMTTVGYGDKSPRSLGGRIVALVWMFTAIIIISSFTASIASSLMVDHLDAQITNLDDLRKARVGTVKTSATADFLKNQLINFQSFESVPVGLQALKSKKLDAFVYDRPILNYEIRKDSLNKLEVLPFLFNQQYLSFGFPKGSILVDTINPVLLKEIEGLAWKTILTENDLKD